MLSIKTILHPTDFSERSEYAFQVACVLARDYGARLVVLHVLEPPLPIYGEGGLIISPPVSSREAVGERLRGIRAPKGDVRLEHRLVEGEPAVEILQIAGEIKPDLIVMGTHGRTGPGRLLMGSVAEGVLRKAPCPVLTVKTPLPQPRLSAELNPTVASTVAEAGR